ncbi:hypothetical protein RZS08_25125, partial [Arthrospira platensis SPKY1]|nr:hypothetical protein [Arthrospira platensis SPKY1]
MEVFTASHATSDRIFEGSSAAETVTLALSKWVKSTERTNSAYGLFDWVAQPVISKATSAR